MDFNQEAELDTSQVEDLRGSSGGGGVGGRVAIGGGGVSIVGLLIYFLLSQLTGSNVDLGGLGQLPELGGGSSTSQQQGGQAEALKQKCQSGKDIANNLDCEATAVVNSLQNFWKDQLARSSTPYRPATTRFFSGPVNTGCGQATSDVGPFYCPADGKVYIDLSFYQDLEQKFGAAGGPFARSYVLAHEYGHHVQNILGQSDRVRSRSGATSDGVRLELQADCYAGAWANHATQTTTASGQKLINRITQDDIEAALDTAMRIGDDFIQKNLGGGRVNESQFTHGSSAQREKWLRTGLASGNPADCNTFGAGVNLG